MKEELNRPVQKKRDQQWQNELIMASPDELEFEEYVKMASLIGCGTITVELMKFLQKKRVELGLDYSCMEALQRAAVIPMTSGVQKKIEEWMETQTPRNPQTSQNPQKPPLKPEVQRSEKTEIFEKPQDISEITKIRQNSLVVTKNGYGNYMTISEAIENAKHGQTIFVKPGIYKEGLIIDKQVDIIGDGPVDEIIIESTGIDCVLMDAARATVKNLSLHCRGDGSHTKFSAVDIPRGKLILESCDIVSDSYACVEIHGAMTNPTIDKCRIHNGRQCGIFVYGSGKGTILDCDIYENALAGIEIKENASPEINKCRIYNGKSCGILVHSNGKGTIEGCHIYKNNHSGILIETNSRLYLKGCRIYKNNGEGIFLEEGSSATIEDCDLRDNVKGPCFVGEGCKIKQIGSNIGV